MPNPTKPTPEDMLRKLILFFVVKTKGHLTKIQLVKFLYLADLYAVKWTGKQITHLNWIYYKHGPWESSIENALKEMEGHWIHIRDDRNTQLLEPTPQAEAEELELPYSLCLMLENIRRAWAGSGREHFDDLLDYVYNTEPMRQVRAQHQPSEKIPLDLSLEAKKLQEALGEVN